MLYAFIAAIGAILIDQVTKLVLYGKSCSLIGDFLWLESPGLNTGASFGIFEGKAIYLILFTIPVVALIVYLIISKKVSKSLFFKISLGIVLGGIIGNLVDRIALGGVRDFIYLKSIDFAIFNFADIFINIGAFMLVGYFIYEMVREIKKSKVQKNSAEGGEKK